ncbi:uncharacterized protein EV420DRAFT_1645549 [Desarmillaria tabescens]|uniref:Uncharacterized protein n=1 Tax=Armillaria tabescens TaxID=1929756 RepID=A0AA39N0T8_ARMTA|nr:uncharacterized protein EV420DRAFT_1645549 [Desarmillaria tabescens]KAK0453020.1 hypothetical protein EV420DRAFT_1645549 [Desarmillaria tabescens]
MSLQQPHLPHPMHQQAPMLYLVIPFPTSRMLPANRGRHKRPAPKEVVILCGAEKEHGPPQWLNDSFEGMHDESLGPSWLSLLEKWRELELGIWEDSALMGKLPTKLHPHALALWLDGARSFEAGPIISDSSVYMAEIGGLVEPDQSNLETFDRWTTETRLFETNNNYLQGRTAGPCHQWSLDCTGMVIYAESRIFGLEW